MANQPPARPWFRMSNLARQPPPPPPPVPTPVAQPPQQPRIQVIRTAFRPAFTQSQAAPPPPPPPPPQSAPPTATHSPTPTQPPSPPSPPMLFTSPSPSPPPPPPPPPPPHVVASPPPPPPSPPRSYVSSSPPLSTRMSRLPTPIASPIKTTHSPPPINLPPPQFNSTLPEAEQEKVLLQETFNKKPVFPTSDQGNSVKGFGHKGVHNSNKNGRVKEAGARKSSSSDFEDGKNVSIIHMTGENKGALMELGFSPRRNEGKTLANFPGSGHKLGNVLKGDEGLDSGDADLSKMKDHDQEMETPSRVPMSGYVNSNVQAINNSILFNCSFTHHDPGVHFSVSRKKPINGKAHHGNGHENGKKT